MVNTEGYWKKNLESLGFTLRFLKNEINLGYYRTMIRKPYADSGYSFNIEIGGVHGCCGAFQISLFNLPLKTEYHNENISSFKLFLKECLKDGNNIASYLTAGNGSAQDYYARVLKEVGFQPVHVCTNKNSGNLCTTWMADLSKLEL